MTKKKIILYVIAIICAISGIVALPSGNIAGGIGSLIIAAALALWGSKSTPQKATQPRTHIIPVQPAVAPTETIRTKLTGVTFENEDGENRQDILAEMTGDEEIEVEKYTFNGEPAARIKWGEKVLGNISAELARDLALKYPSAQYAANLLEISGGGVQYYGCNIELDIFDTAEVKTEQKAETIVYVDKKSKKYHTKPDCSGMKRPVKIPLEKARKKYTPCKKCCK